MPLRDRKSVFRLDSLREPLADTGLILRGGFHPVAGDDAPADTGTILLVGNAGPAMWKVFEATCATDGPDPLNTWTRQALGQIAERFAAKALYPFEGPPYWPFQRWAARTESAYPSPLGMLIHPEYGLWHAWRGALAFPERLDLPERRDVGSPCDGCATQPCLSACPVSAFGEAGYDTNACAAWMRSPGGTGCQTRGCIARHACPEGDRYRYAPAQAQLHMAAFLNGQSDSGLRLREYRPEDAPALAQLFHDSVHRAAAGDYTRAQRDAWAPQIPEPERFHERLTACDTVIVAQGTTIVGFSSLDEAGLVDMFYVHAERQRHGAGRLLYRRIEGLARIQGHKRLTTDASITARPFFEAMGFTVIRKQTVSRNGVALTNFAMEKRLTR